MGIVGAWRALLAGAVTAVGCSPAAPPPPGEVLLTIDTDAPVPALVSRLRVDVLDASGNWLASRDFGLPEPGDWPASFAVSAPDDVTTTTVILRLRAYPDGQVRDYRGERFQDWADPGGDLTAILPTPGPTPGGTPRLVVDAQDVTPATEPQPLVAIDRLLRVTVVPDVVQGATVVLRGACFGTMADVAGDLTCVDTEATRVADADLPLSTPPPAAPASLAGTFGASACTATPRAGSSGPDGTPLHDAEVCVPGGAFVFGSGASPAIAVDRATTAPARVAVVPPLLVDAYEMTVARYRAVLRAGYTGPQEVATNDAAIPSSAQSLPAEETAPYCTYSDQPLGRETFPLTCVSRTTARAVCQFLGGDLPTEVQWEYVAAQSGRSAKTRYPWGDGAPTCSLATFGRGVDFITGMYDPCAQGAFGPQPVGSSGDLSEALGVADLAGSATEWILDTAESLASRCWMSAPLEAPSCQIQGVASYSLRGGSWLTPFGAPTTLLASTRAFNTSAHLTYTDDGFRCARGGGGP